MSAVEQLRRLAAALRDGEPVDDLAARLDALADDVVTEKREALRAAAKVLADAALCEQQQAGSLRRSGLRDRAENAERAADVYMAASHMVRAA